MSRKWQMMLALDIPIKTSVEDINIIILLCYVALILLCDP